MKRAIFITFTAKSDSVKLEKYIKQLLQDNEMVIVPGFGAFITEYLPAVVDDASGEIKPPSSKLIFDPKIKNNDGLLVGQVADATRCTHFEALQKIEKERDNIIYQLDKGEKVELDEIGVLLYNAEKQIVLVSEEDAHLALENFGLAATSIEESVAIKNEEQIPEPNPESEEINQLVEEDLEPIEKEAKTLEEKGAQEEQEKESTKYIVDKSMFIPEPEEKKKRKAGWIWLLVILIPLIAVSVFIYIKDQKSVTPPTTTQEPVIQSAPEEIIAEKDTVSQDSSLTEAADTSQVQQISTEPEPSKTEEMVAGKFYLVGGSFKSEENAETYLQSLREKGFEPFHLGKYGNFYIVGIGSYDTESEALTAKHEYLENNPGSGVWVLER
ncbi:MAG TPA: SPOR domain-containing protein [Draconibacterium sp.]|nr:SPOR domain-containing protein [Draconibacterium sp.]